ncbi:hypothetical protein CRV24_009353 [Beauveria bassiana]|nr:hypothetical protein CRV24_009353 [Beauveria bassiana]
MSTAPPERPLLAERSGGPNASSNPLQFNAPFLQAFPRPTGAPPGPAPAPAPSSNGTVPANPTPSAPAPPTAGAAKAVPALAGLVGLVAALL